MTKKKESILDIPLASEHDEYGHWLGGNTTIREFFADCFLTFWREGEGFNSKRPFGNSGWENELVFAVAKHRNLPGRRGEPLVDEEGYFNSIEEKDEDQILRDITAALQEWLGVNE